MLTYDFINTTNSIACILPILLLYDFLLYYQMFNRAYDKNNDDQVTWNNRPDG